jgi:hypothetical protein
MGLAPEMRERLALLVGRFDTYPEYERTPLIYDMEAAGGVPGAGELARSADVEDRRVAARLMELLPDEAHVEPLAALVGDPDRQVAGYARLALRGQVRSPAWYALVERLAAGDDADLAAAAAEWLAEGVRG